MKKDQPGPRVMLRFYQMQFTFLFIVVGAVIVWSLQDFAASFAASEMTTTTTLRTTEEPDDARFLRAYKSATESLRIIPTTLVTEPNPQQRTRDAVLTFTGPSSREVLDARASLVPAIQAAFAREGPGELFDIGVAPHATPVPSAAGHLVRQIFRGVAAALLLVGVVILLLQWKRSRLPKAALAGIIATVAGIALIGLGDEGTVIWIGLLVAALPIAFLVLMVYVTVRVQRAKGWQQGSARITQSKVDVERHRFAGDTTEVRNKAGVSYEFEADGKTIRGDRISIGFAPADNVNKVLKRYRNGAMVPVFYDPSNPKDCVLERDPPVGLGCLWSGALVLLLIYGTCIAWFVFGKSPNTLLATVFPQVHHPFWVLICGGLGLLSLASGIYHLFNPRQTEPWRRTMGTIVSSEVEMYYDSSGSSNTQRKFYKAVTEYSYEAEGHTYHGTIGGSGSLSVSISAGEAYAQEQAAKYKPGMKLEIFYDPSDPTRSSLTDHGAISLSGRHSLIVAAIMLTAAWYLATH